VHAFNPERTLPDSVPARRRARTATQIDSYDPLGAPWQAAQGRKEQVTIGRFRATEIDYPLSGDESEETSVALCYSAVKNIGDRRSLEE
jgi:hypothetical protein